MTVKELEQAIRAGLKEPLSDADLRERLEELAEAERAFPGFTWLWGPELYQRNRVFFRPFVLSRFSTYTILPKWRIEVTRWSDHSERLQRWLEEADKHDDVELFRKILEWKVSHFGWRRSAARFEELRRDLLARFSKASTPAQRQIVLRKLDLWFEMDEATALTLYKADSASSQFILRHLPSHWYHEHKRTLWEELIATADARQDSDFRWRLYRRQVPEKKWIADVLALANTTSDSATLNSELQKRHPEGWGINAASAFHQLLERRGRDVFPYVMGNLRTSVRRGWLMKGAYGKMLELASQRGWWDLWSALIRTWANPKEFNGHVRSLLENGSPVPEVRRERLRALAGVSREWNWPGLGIAQVHQLDDATAVVFYEREPELLKTSFRLHLQAHRWGEDFPSFLKLMIDRGEDDLVDLLASRIVTASGRWGNAPKQLEQAVQLAEYYGKLKTDEAVFCRRAAAVLGQIPARSIWQYNELIRTNPLARLLFERSARSYLADPRALSDLVEGAEIHVMGLAYRALGLDDPRAREQAAFHLPLILGTLLRPLQRETRALAFSAVANGATNLSNAQRILSRAREALRLPDKKYPKEKLLGLIAAVLHRWPELREPAEQPVIYERAA